MKAEQIWQAALGELQMQMTKATFDTWLKSTAVLSYADHELVIACPNQYTQEWLDNRLKTTIQRILSGITGQLMRARFEVWRPIEPVPDPVKLSESVAVSQVPQERAPIDWADLGIPSKFSRESLATLDWTWPTLQAPGLRDYVDHARDYWQAGLGLLLIGPVGNGETHLVMGLAKYAVEHDWTIAVTSAAQFLDELRSSYAAVRAGDRTGATDRIVQRLTDVDLLVIDDLCVTDWTPWCRSQFFTLINRCWENEVPLLITSNHALNDLADRAGQIGLDEATLSRLTGSTVRITLSGPDYRLERKRRVLTTLRSTASSRIAVGA
jgi:chromosomal replication initiator protein